MEEKKPVSFMRAKTPEEFVDLLVEEEDNAYCREVHATLWILFGDHHPCMRMEHEASDKAQELYDSGLSWDEISKRVEPMRRAAKKKAEEDGFNPEEGSEYTRKLDQKVMKLLEERTNAKNSR